MTFSYKVDDYDVEIRRIHKRDAKMRFRTGDRIFDEVNPSGTLREYKDSEMAENFKVYILREVKNNKVLGVLRLRFEFEGAMLESIPLVIDQPSIYLSRVGVERSQSRVYLGSILVYFFLYITQKEFRKNPKIKSIFVYLKCRRKDCDFYSRNNFKITHEYEDKWGKSVVMAREFRK